MSASAAEARRATTQISAGARTGHALGRVATYTLVGAVALLLAIPFLWMIGTSLKTDSELVRFPPRLWPDPVAWSNYVRTFTRDDIPIHRFALNSMIVTILAVIGQVLTSTMVGFAFARLQWFGRNVCFGILLATMMLPSQVTIVPVFIMFSKLGWTNSWLPLIVPAWFGSPFFIFLVRQFMLTLPRDLDDAARIDGCNTWQLYSQVILPLCKPVVAAVAVFSFQGHWNDFFNPLIYITDPEKQLLSVGITYLTTVMSIGPVSTPWNTLMAVSLAMTVPMIVIFFAAQRVFVKGVVFSGLKG
ncbi:MAG: multiple sugar transport system permease protein [Thermomicrobiales bacterium]|jgi:ABC-type glycerol-3-phosphate transport system permease component|nr:multiple sugar transport system permease protein [Thermomicrobiales bacterium]MEA2526706.1 multiple sugar transport system permease protein [Thermomicrobiales bacterium]MEA2598651.1 multiple sugar transport system permease protein [Thermomicrobiales bacterium]